MYKILVTIAFFVVVIFLPIVIISLINTQKAQAGWAPNFEKWLKRKQLTLTNNSGGTVSTNATVAITVDTETMYNSGQIQSDCDDLRVVYESGTTNKELTRHLVYPSGATCSTSGATKVYFSLQADLSTGASSTSYYMYYQNTEASTPTNTDNAFDIGSVDALLVCPFDNSSTCAAGETPSTESGAVRYSGNKGAISFDEYDDRIQMDSLTIPDGTIEFWFYPKRYGTYGVGDWLFNKPVSTWNGFKIYMQTSGDIRVGTGGTDRITASSNVTLNQWQHIAVTFGSSGMTLYINGVSKGTSAVTDGLDDFSSTYSHIGNVQSSNYSAPLGYIDEFRISNIVRYPTVFTPSTQPFIRDDYTKILYHFDENGNDPRNSGEVKDDSGNNYDGTLTGTSFVGGLVGVDSSSSTIATGNVDRQTYLVHEGVFIEEGTTNKITNPSFEHGTYDTSWTENSSATISENTTASYYKFGSKSMWAETTTTSYTSSSTYTGLYSATSNKRLGQGFQTSSNSSPVSVDLYLQRSGSSSTRYIQVEIQTDNSGVPSNTPVANGTTNCLSFNSVNQNPAEYQNFTFSSAPSLTASTQYHTVIKVYSDACVTEMASNDGSNYIRWSHQAASSYAGGTRATMADTGTWTSASTTDFRFRVHENTSSVVTSINAGNTNNHVLSVYAFNASYFAENNHDYAETIDSTVAELIYNGSAVTTTYTNIGDGWWRLSYSAAGINGSADYGVELKSAKALYLDGVQLEEKSYATTYADGSLGTGYAWTSTENDSTSTRTKADIYYSAASTNISGTAGSVSFWLKTPWAGDDSVLHELFAVDTSVGTLRLYKDTDNSLKLYDGTNTASKAISWAANTWQHIVADWGSSNMHVYVSNSAGAAAGAFSTPTINTSGYINIGESTSEASQANGTISDFRIFDSVVSSTQVSDLYYAGLVGHSEGITADRFSGDKGQDPVGVYHFDEGYGTTAYDSGAYGNNLTLAGSTSFEVSSDKSLGGVVGVRSLEFDGDGDYISRAQDSDFDFGSGSFSISGYFKHPSTISAQETILSKYGTAGYKVYLTAAGLLCFGIDGDSTWSPADDACSSTSLADSNWHHFEAVKDGTSSITLYVDGNQIDQDDSLSTNGNLSSSSTFYMGIDSDGAANDYKGFLDEIIIYPYARSADQVKTDYSGGQTGTVFGTSTEDPLTEGLVGYWKLDESSGNASDSSGNANTLTDGNSTTYASAKFANGADLESSSTDYLYIADNATLSLTGSLTISAWIKPESVTASTLFDIAGKWDGASESYLLAQYGDEIRLYIDSASNYIETSSTNLTAGTWYHVTGTYDSSNQTVKIFVNGSLQSVTTTGTITTSIGDDTDRFQIGAEDSTGGAANYYDGIVDDVRLYNRLLSVIEASRLYSWAAGPVAYWKMDEGNGQYILDSSGNSITGTLGASASSSSDDPMWTNGKYGNGLIFDGSDDFIDIPDDNLLDPGTGLFTVQAWFKTSSTSCTTVNSCAIYFDYGDSTNASIQLVVGDSYDGGTQACFRDDSGEEVCVASSTDVRDGIWHHLTAVRDTQTSMALYFDGVNIGSDSNVNMTSITVTGTYNASIGSINGEGRESFFDGVIDDVKIYNYARTTGQVIEDMNANHPAPGSPIGSPVGYWKFDEGYGDTANDASPHDNDGDLAGSCPGGSTCPTWTNSGKFNKALNFDGNDEYVDAGTDSSLDMGSDNLTVSAWFKATEGSVTQTILQKGEGSTAGKRYGLYLDNTTSCSANQANFEIDDDTTKKSVCSTNTYFDNLWHHVVGIRDGNYLRLYIDGVEANTPTDITGYGNIDSARFLTFGGGWNNTSSAVDTFLYGTLDEVQIFNSALTADQVKILYNQGQSQVLGSVSTDASGNESWGADRSYCPPGDTTANCAPLGYWKMDENTGSSVNDTSGNGYTGTWQGTLGSQWSTGKFGSGGNFNGSDNYISTNTGNSVKGLTQFTIEAWINTSVLNSAVHQIYSEARNSDASYRVDFAISSDNQLYFGGRAPDSGSYTTWVNDNRALTVNTWYHVAAVFDSVTDIHHIYLNGVDYNATVADDAIDNTNPLRAPRIGSDAALTAANLFNGKIDDVKIYNYARTPAQIAWEYNQGAPQLYYKFDECTGSTLNNAAPAASGGDSGNDATIYPVSNGNDATGTCSSGDTTEMWNNGSTGKYNASLDFDGNDDYAVSGASALIAASAVTYTKASWGGWVKTGSTPNGDVIMQRGDTSSATQQEFRLTTDASGVPQCGVCSGSTCSWNSVTGTAALTTSSWTHLICTYDGTDIKIYVNGKQDNSAAHSTAITSRSTGVVSIARDPQSPSGTYIDAQIDEAKIWAYDLTLDQVKTDYNQGAAVRF